MSLKLDSRVNAKIEQLGQCSGKIDFHEQKLSSLSIAYDAKLKGHMYSMLSAEASRRP